MALRRRVPGSNEHAPIYKVRVYELLLSKMCARATNTHKNCARALRVRTSWIGEDCYAVDSPRKRDGVYVVLQRATPVRRDHCQLGAVNDCQCGRREYTVTTAQ
jgi:hypothetical protein